MLPFNSSLFFIYLFIFLFIFFIDFKGGVYAFPAFVTHILRHFKAQLFQNISIFTIFLIIYLEREHSHNSPTVKYKSANFVCFPFLD